MFTHKVMSIRDKVWFDKFYTEALASQEVNIQDEDLQIEQLHTYVLDWIENTEGPTFYNNRLLRDFQNEFKGWSAVTFNDFDKKVRKALKEHVISRGIYIPNANTRSSVPVQLADLLDLEKCPKWPANKLAEVAKGPAFATTQALKPGSRSAIPIPAAVTPKLSSRLATPVPIALVILAQVSTVRTANSVILAANAKEPQFQKSQFQNS
jgi:hypothetical protein